MYIRGPPALEQKHRPKLEMTLQELIDAGNYSHSGELVITDPTVSTQITFTVTHP